MIEKTCAEKLADYEHDLDIYLVQNSLLRNAMKDAVEILEMCIEDGDDLSISTLRLVADLLSGASEIWKRP